MYTTLLIAGNLRNFNNLCFLISLSSDSSMAVPNTLVFHDSKQDATDAYCILHATSGAVTVRYYNMSPTYTKLFSRVLIYREFKSLFNMGCVRIWPRWYSKLDGQYMTPTWMDCSWLWLRHGCLTLNWIMEEPLIQINHMLKCWRRTHPSRTEQV